MAKYIIEIEDVPSMLEDGVAFYKCVDAPWWYISDMHINRLKPYEDAERNTGEWREHIFDGIMGGRPRALMCTKCNVISIYASNFCPFCGQKLEAPEQAIKGKISDERYRITLTEKQLSLIGHAVDMILGMAYITRKYKSDEELEYETIYSAIRNYEITKNLNVGKYYYPVQCGEEPIPEIERVE